MNEVDWVLSSLIHLLTLDSAVIFLKKPREIYCKEGLELFKLFWGNRKCKITTSIEKKDTIFLEIITQASVQFDYCFF